MKTATKPELLALLAALAFMPAAALAQDAAAEPAASADAPATQLEQAARDERPIALSTGGWFSHTFRTDVDDSGDGADADIAVSRVGADLTLSGSLGQRWRWFVPVSYEYSRYDFGNAGGLVNATPGDEPFENGHIVTVSPSLAYVIDQHWSVRGGFIVQAAFEGGADFSDSLTFGGAIGARYAFSETFALTFGIAAKSRLEDSALVLPVIGAEWRIDDKFTLSSGAGGGGNGGRGPGIGLYYAATDTLTLSVGGSFEFREYRLEEDDTDASEGVFSDQRVNITFGVDWQPTKVVSVGAFAGVAVWQEFEFQDDDGDTLHEANADPTGVVGVNVSIRF